MNTRKLSDKRLDLYIEEACEAMLSALPEPSECRHEFSGAFTAKNEKFLRRFRLRRAAHTWARNAAAVFLVFVLGFGAFLGIDGEARADFLAWLKSAYEGSVIYRYAGDSEAPLPTCELTWLPEGYELVLEDRDENSLAMVYKNDSGEGFIFSCDRMTENSLAQIFQTGENIVKQVTVNGMSGELYIAADGSNENDLVLMDNDQGFFYYLGANSLEESVIMHIAENIKITK